MEVEMLLRKKSMTNTLTPAEAARKLGLGLDYIYLLIWSGKLLAIKEDGRWLIPLAAIEQRLKVRGVNND